MQNPLIIAFDTAYDTAPFNDIHVHHYEPAIEIAIDMARDEIQAIVKNQQAANFENTIEALDKAGDTLGRITSIFFNLNSAETNEQIQAIARKISPQLTQFNNDITLNDELFDRVKSLYNNKENLKLTPEQHTLLLD